jgi:tetratricopeptide (TPR) repeat protein
VDVVLEGSAVRSGNRIRTTARLIDAKTDHHLWGQSFDRDFGDALVLQSEIAQAVAQQVHARLTPQEHTRLASARKVNPEAYEAYLKGIFHRNTTREGLDTAKRYFDLALEKDPDSALAYSGVARVWASRQQYGFASPQEAGPRLVEAAEKALARDSGLAEVHYTLAVMKGWTLWDFKEAEASFQRAIELKPNYPDARVLYARLLNILGRPAEALPQIERALDLDPHNSFFRGMYAVDLCWAGRYDEAIAIARQALSRDPNQLQAETALRAAFEAKGMLKEALEIQIRRMNQDRELAQVLQRGYDQGKYREAARAGAELLEARWRNGAFVPAARISVFFQLAGMPDKVLEWLERGVEQRDPNVLGGLGFVRRGLPELAHSPRFQAMLKRAGLPQR